MAKSEGEVGETEGGEEAEEDAASEPDEGNDESEPLTGEHDAESEASSDLDSTTGSDDVDTEADSEVSVGSPDEGEPRRPLRPGATERRQEHTTLRGRIAAGIRESSPVGRLREIIFPLLSLCLLLFLLLSFRTVLLPFILACMLVYLMEPIVRRLGGGPEQKGYVPRWVAVIFVYLVFIGSVSVFSVLVIPRFVTEIVRFAETVPQVVQEFREERLPDIDARVQDFLRSYLPARQRLPDYVIAKDQVRNARAIAAERATAMGAAKQSIHHATSSSIEWEVLPAAPNADERGVTGRYRLVPPGPPPERLSLEDALASNSGWTYGPQTGASIRLAPSDDGGVEVFLQGVAVEVEKTDDNVWTVRESRQDDVPVSEPSLAIEERFNLQRTLDDVIESLVTTSNARISSAIEVVQKLVVGIVGGFVAVILTLMVAAFISIDLPRVMSFLRGLVPDRAQGGFDILVQRLDTGLAGVVRGQLMICLVNGIFTYIGLVILDVKFSVLLAVVAGVLSLIPVFGTIISTIPIVLIALTDGLMTGVLALGWILLIHFVEANILNPKIIGSSAHIHPVIVIFALLAGESAFGLVGALLAVPTASIILTLFEFVRTRAWREGDSDSEAEPA